MFARVRPWSAEEGEVEETIRNYNEIVVPTVKGLAGFRGVYLLVNRQTGRGLSITLWETEKDLQDSAGVARERMRATSTPVDTTPTFDVYALEVQA